MDAKVDRLTAFLQPYKQNAQVIAKFKGSEDFMVDSHRQAYDAVFGSSEQTVQAGGDAEVEKPSPSMTGDQKVNQPSAPQ